MKFGICLSSLEQAEQIKAMGYDYFECGFASVADMSEEEFQAFKAKIHEMEFFPEAMNVMVPGRYRITGAEADIEAIRPFLEKGFKRGSEVGLQTVVFGSGGARNLPEGFTDYERAYQQLEDYLKMAGVIAAKYGVTIAIEPLRFGESNIVNLVSEGAYLAARTNHPSVRVLADYYHVARNKEDCESIVGFAHRMEHCHIACENGRTYPLPEDGQDYSPFFRALITAGYDKRVSIEGSIVNTLEEDAPRSLALMKNYILSHERNAGIEMRR